MITGVHAANIASAGLSNTSISIARFPGNPAASSTTGNSPFSDLMNDAIGNVSELESQARTAIDGLISGSGVDVHQAMIASEKASMAFEMALAVRNKAIQSYQSVMGMQF
jgi:flagellar hook-basal body complex protein FliE